MAIINFEQMKATEPDRNFDNATIDENYNIGMQNGAGLYGAGKFFGLVQKAVNWLSTITGNKNFTGVVSMNDKKVATEEKAGELIATALTDYPTNSQTDTKINNALAKFNFSGATELNASSDLNNIKTEGLYFCNGAVLPVNAPDTTPKGYNCLIKVSKQGIANRYVQEFYSLNTKKTFIRNCGVSAVDVWSNWEAVVTETDLANYEKKVVSVKLNVGSATLNGVNGHNYLIYLSHPYTKTGIYSFFAETNGTYSVQTVSEVGTSTKPTFTVNGLTLTITSSCKIDIIDLGLYS